MGALEEELKKAAGSRFKLIATDGVFSMDGVIADLPAICELADRFGAMPEAARNLENVIRLKIRARRLGIVAIDYQQGELVLTAAQTTKVDPQRLLRLLTQARGGLRVTPGHKIHAPVPHGGSEKLFQAVQQLLDKLGEST